MSYFEIEMIVQPRDPWVEIFLADLSEYPFDTFEETEKGLKAFIPKDQYDSDLENYLNSLVQNGNYSLEISKKEIEQENWNSVWESSFEPINVNDWVCIRAPFHEKEHFKKVNFEYDIVIEPKMSFGTGHHQTTHMMVEAMKSVTFSDKRVLDMGSGTGVLAILAKKMSAVKVDAVEIEEGAFQNCIENCGLNQESINCLLGGKEQVEDCKYNVVLANINKNILLDQLEVYADVLISNGDIIISGFLEVDADELSSAFAKKALIEKNRLQKDNWICMHLVKN